MSTEPELSAVERRAVEASRFDACYPPTEKLPVVVCNNVPALGQLAATRFLEWAQQHPGGVVSLPTGKTPEYFIAAVRRLLATWEQAETQERLRDAGLDPSVRPDMGSLHFVQIDEFYPIDPAQENSFFHYVNEFYVKGFGLDPAKGLFMNCAEIGLANDERLDEVWPDGRVDLSLRHRHAAGARERRQKDRLGCIDQWCQDYEDRVRALGGLGFFLGGIGPDGHVGFNVRGSDHHSTTRLAPTNYETQAAAATDLGGMHIARNRLVITIGLGTITWNPDCAAIIIAAGAAKAGVVADAVQNEPDVRYPATALHRLPGARFYVTAGAAGRLAERRLRVLSRTSPVRDEEVDRALIDLAVAKNKRLIDLTDADVADDRFARAAVGGRPETRETLVGRTRDRLVDNIERGAHPRSGTRCLPAEPHHDDVMLGELPYVVRHTRDATNTSHFVT
ncbi:MAG: 6-phosphogluconolactonase, partial [bacterium]